MWWMAFISKLIPKKKNLYIFGSMNGYQVVDNPLYLYINIEIDCERYFITKNKEILNDRLADGSFPIYAYSPKGVLLQLRAERVYFSHGIYDFVPYLIWGSEKHNLWHGVAIKEVGQSADWKFNSKLFRKVKLKLNRLFAYAYYMSCDYVYCPFADRIDDYKRYFEVSHPEVRITSSARIMYAPAKHKESKILYAPTYRPYYTSRRDYKDFLRSVGLFSGSIQTFLQNNNTVLVVRSHPIDKQFLQTIQLPNGLFIDETPDIYQSLKEYSAVITDYSSIYYDCKEMGSDCYILAPDLEQYNNHVGMDNRFYYNVAIEKADTFIELIDKLKASITSGGMMVG